MRHLDLVFNRRVLLAMHFSPRGYPVVNLNPILISPPPVWYCGALTWFSVGLFFFLSKPPRVDSRRGVSITPFLCVERKGLSERVRGTYNRSADKRLGGWGRGDVLKSRGRTMPRHRIFMCLLSRSHFGVFGRNS